MSLVGVVIVKKYSEDILANTQIGCFDETVLNLRPIKNKVIVHENVENANLDMFIFKRSTF